MSPGGGGSRQAAVWVPGHFYGHDVLGPALLPERLGRWADGTLRSNTYMKPAPEGTQDSQGQS